MTKIAIHTELNTSFALTGGERVWKLTGAIERMSINGRDYFDQSTLNDKTLYTSPYMVVTDREYTKHYYIESQRVTSKLGGGMANNLVDPNSGTLDCIAGDIDHVAVNLMANLQQTTCVDGMGIEVEPQLKFIEESIQQDDDETEQYFYHGDHLGSSSWITNASGNVDQHLAYMPFGESFIDQRASGHDIRFKFTGKERDSKTGFDYFGARYYASDLSVWLSVDPLASKYPGISPYAYVYNNPVNFIDPWGLEGVKDPNGKTTNAGDGYKATSDGKYLHGEGLKTKVWNPDLELGTLSSGQTKGGYETYTGDAIDFGSYGKSSNANGGNEKFSVTNGLGLSLEIAFPDFVFGHLTDYNGVGLDFGFFRDANGFGGYYTTKSTKESAIAFSIQLEAFSACHNSGSSTRNITRNYLEGPGYETSLGITAIGGAYGASNASDYNLPSQFSLFTISVGPGLDLGFVNWKTNTHYTGN